LILDDGSLADAGLRLSGACRKRCGQAKRGEIQNAVTPIHLNTD
jgi:hypothetical protein